MSMILITGTPGSGKTLYAVSKIKKWIEQGRTVYADIDGLTIEGVEKSPDDWRTTPDGSVIVYDEAQQKDIFKKTRSTLSDNKIVSDFEIHRHTGHDIVFITQSPIFLHTHIRELIGEHYHLHRPYGAKLANIYFWRMCQNNPNSKTAKAQVETTSLFNYHKKLFTYYKSATIHTHKLRVPPKIIMMVLGCIIAAFVIYHFAGKSRYLSHTTEQIQTTTTNETQSQPNQQLQSTTQNMPQTTLLKDDQTKDLEKKLDELYSHNLQIVKYNPLLRVAAVIQKDDGCRAYNIDGELLTMPYMDCIAVTQRMFSGRSSEKGNDLRTNAHQGLQNNEQQTSI